MVDKNIFDYYTKLEDDIRLKHIKPVPFSSLASGILSLVSIEELESLKEEIYILKLKTDKEFLEKEFNKEIDRIYESFVLTSLWFDAFSLHIKQRTKQIINKLCIDKNYKIITDNYKLDIINSMSKLSGNNILHNNFNKNVMKYYNNNLIISMPEVPKNIVIEDIMKCWYETDYMITNNETI